MRFKAKKAGYGKDWYVYDLEIMDWVTRLNGATHPDAEMSAIREASYLNLQDQIGSQ